jgi:aspartyl-tRNA(Asn)/glutamyl-tRNA(Gln) amidotransferase subunit A
MLTIAEFGRLWRQGEMSAVALVERCLARIDSEQARLNAFILVMADDARRQAETADRERGAGIDRGPLHGVPISLKDLIDVRGVATTAASRVRDGHVADRDAPVVTRLREAGAVLVGKTNLHEFAFGTTNEDSAFGPARNPHDPMRSPGGSSGGSAISVATGMSLASIGTDTGGSIRIPAAACGIVGLKGSYGEVSTEGVVPLSRTLDHVGPLALSVADAWTVHGALAGRTPSLETRSPRGLRVGVLRSHFCELLDEDVRASFESALAAMCDAGAIVDDVAVPHASLVGPAYLHLGFGDAAAIHGPMLDAMPERYTTPVRLRLETARYVLAEDYARALAAREVLRWEVDALLADRDALVLPTLPIPAPLIGASTVRIGDASHPIRALTLRLTQLFNLTGNPAVSLPCGTTPGGLPCGLQLVGRRGETGDLVRTAMAIEALVAPASS